MIAHVQPCYLGSLSGRASLTNFQKHNIYLYRHAYGFLKALVEGFYRPNLMYCVIPVAMVSLITGYVNETNSP